MKKYKFNLTSFALICTMTVAFTNTAYGDANIGGNWLKQKDQEEQYNYADPAQYETSKRDHEENEPEPPSRKPRILTPEERRKRLVN